MIATYRHTAFEHEEFTGVDGADLRTSVHDGVLPVVPEIRKTNACKPSPNDILDDPQIRDRMDRDFYNVSI